MLEGHRECASCLEQSVEDLLLHPVRLDQAEHGDLLVEVDPVFSEADNNTLLKVPTKKYVLETLADSNQHAAQGTDGLTINLYNQCIGIMGDSLIEVTTAVLSGKNPTLSQRTSMMVFGLKPKKANSL